MVERTDLLTAAALDFVRACRPVLEAAVTLGLRASLAETAGADFPFRAAGLAAVVADGLREPAPDLAGLAIRNGLAAGRAAV